MVQRQSPFDRPWPIAFAHRGGNERFPENTLAAFQDAYKLGYRYFETDVHYTVDHELVAFHDDNLGRILGLHGGIAGLTKASRQSTLIDGNHHVPLLAELLETFPDAYFNIDTKSAAAVEPLIKTIKKQQATDRVCLASFDMRNIRRMRQLLPKTSTMATTFETMSLKTIPKLARFSNAPTRYLEIPTHFFYERRRVRFVTPRFISTLHAGGHKIFVWTINDPTEMHALLDMGVDGLFTDKLRVLKAVLIERNQWHP
jgi:glycerophosphoryl diester phosphodiesterase